MPTTTIEVPDSSIALIYHALEREQAIMRVSLNNTQRKLDAFERKYEMSSDEFIGKFERGEAGDAQDAMLWAAEYESLTTLKAQLDEIRGLLATWET